MLNITPTLPSAADLVPPIPAALPALSVTFPGGATLQSFPKPEDITQPLRLAKSLVDQAAPLLASLAPLFKLLDLIMSLVRFAQSVPNLISDPSSVAQAIVDVVEKSAAVAALIPQLSVPLMIVGLIDLIITFLEGMVGLLTQLADEAARAQAALQKVADLQAAGLDTDRLAAMANTMQANVVTQTANVSAGLGPVGKIIDVINLMASLAGLPELPGIGGFADPAQGVQVLGDFVSTIRSIRDAIPV